MRQSTDYPRKDRDPLHLQCIYSHLYALICVDIIIFLELAMDDVDEFADLNADVVTSLLVVFCPLVHQSEEIRTTSDSN